MRCPNCFAEDRKSRLDHRRLDPENRETERYWDEDGKLHVHDHTIYRDFFSCTNGHNNLVRSKGRCPQPGCDWNSHLEVDGVSPVRT